MTQLLVAEVLKHKQDDARQCY